MSNPNPYGSDLLAAIGNPTGYGGGLLASLWRRLTEERQQMGPARFREMLRNSPEVRNQPHPLPSGLPQPVRGDATVANERHAPAPQRQATVGPLDRHAQEAGRQDELRKERRQRTYEAIPQPVRGAMNAYEGAVGVLPGRIGEAARALPVALGHEVAGGAFDLNEAAGEQGGLDRSTPDRAMQLLGAFYGYGKLLGAAGTAAGTLGEAAGVTSPLARVGLAHAAQAAVDASQHAESGEERVRNVLFGQALSFPFSAGALRGAMREAPYVALRNSRRITNSLEPAPREPAAFGRDLGGIQRRADTSGGTVNVQGKPVGDGLNPNVRPDLTAHQPEPQNVVGRMRADAERIVSRGTQVVEPPAATGESLRAAVDRIPPAPEQRVPRVAPMSPDAGVESFQGRTTDGAAMEQQAAAEAPAAGVLSNLTRSIRNQEGAVGPRESGQPIRRRDLPASMRVMPKRLGAEETRAWLQGEDAGRKGLTRDVNQHPEGSPEWTAFEQGWRSQQPRAEARRIAERQGIVRTDEQLGYTPTPEERQVLGTEDLRVGLMRADEQPAPSALSRLAEPVRNERGAVGPRDPNDVTDYAALRAQAEERARLDADRPGVRLVGPYASMSGRGGKVMRGEIGRIVEELPNGDARVEFGSRRLFLRRELMERVDDASPELPGPHPQSALDTSVGDALRKAPVDAATRSEWVSYLDREFDHWLSVEDNNGSDIGRAHPDERVWGEIDELLHQRFKVDQRIAKADVLGLLDEIRTGGLEAGTESDVRRLPPGEDTARRGASNIAPLTSIVGGGAGAAYGYTQGDTPEERALNALAYGAGGAVAGGLLPRALVSAARHAGNEIGAFNPGGRGLERFPDGELRAMAQHMDGDPAQETILAELRSRDASLQQHMGAVDEVSDDAVRGDIQSRKPEFRRFYAEPLTEGKWRVLDGETGDVVEPSIGGFDGQRRANAIAERMNREVETTQAPAEGPLAGTRVVDEQGAPKKVYHGTGAAFHDFAERPRSGRFGPGYYFSEAPAVAERYAPGMEAQRNIESATRTLESIRSGEFPRSTDGWGQLDGMPPEAYAADAEADLRSAREGLDRSLQAAAPNVRPARLALRDPFVLDDRPLSPAHAGRIAAAEFTDSAGPADWVRVARNSMVQALTEGSGHDAWEHLVSISGGAEKAQRTLRRAGFDGLKVEGAGPTEWVAFERSQVRSAFGPADDAAQAGAASGTAVRALGGASAGAVVGAATDDEDRARGAAVGAVAGLGVGLAPEVLRGVRNASYAKAVTLWKAGLLTALRTHEVNMASNVANAVGETVKDAPAALGDRVLTAVINNGAVRRTLGIGRRPVGETGGQTALDVGGDVPLLRRTKSRGQSLPVIAGGVAGAVAGATQGDTPGQRARNALVGLAAGSTVALAAVSGRGAREGVHAAREVVMGKRPSSSLARFEVPADQEFTNPFLRAYTNTVFRSLGAVDQLFRSVALHRSLQEQAQTAAMNEGLRGPAATARARNLYDSLTGRRAPDAGDAQVLDAIALRAAGDAEVATFQDRTHVGEALTALGKIPVLGPVVAPFGKTPGAVATRIVEYTPAGYVISAVQVGRLVSALKAGASPAEVEAIQRYAAETFGRATTGTGIIGLGYVLGRLGMATGSYPENAAERQRWQLEGTQEGSVKLGGTWHEFGRLAPFGNLLAIGTNVAEMERRGDGGGFAVRALAATAQGISDQPFLQGAEQFNDARKEPFGGAAERYVRGEAASVIPAGVASLARAIDPVVRQPETLGQAVASKIPWLSRSVPAKVNALGDEVRRTGGALGEFSPLRESRDVSQTDPLVRTLADLNVSIAQVAKQRGESPAAHRQRQQTVGHAVREALSTVTGDVQPPTPPNDATAKRLADDWADYHYYTPEAAREAMSADPELRETWHNDAEALARATRASIVSGVQERVKSEYSTARREALAALSTARRTTANPNTLRRQFNDQMTSGVLLDADFGTVQH